MVTSDANVVLYAHNKGAEQHSAAKIWLEGQLSGSEIFFFNWQTISAFLRISTNHRSFPNPFTFNEATRIVQEWLDLPNVELLVPTARHWDIFKELIVDGQTTGPLIMDAHLAALAIEHGATLATTDRDFSRFPRLKTINPLV